MDTLSFDTITDKGYLQEQDKESQEWFWYNIFYVHRDVNTAG